MVPAYQDVFVQLAPRPCLGWGGLGGVLCKEPRSSWPWRLHCCHSSSPTHPGLTSVPWCVFAFMRHQNNRQQKTNVQTPWLVAGRNVICFPFFRAAVWNRWSQLQNFGRLWYLSQISGPASPSKVQLPPSPPHTPGRSKRRGQSSGHWWSCVGHPLPWASDFTLCMLSPL